MSPLSKRIRSVSLQVGLGLLVGIGGILAFLPVVPCRGSDHEMGHDNRCHFCHGILRISLLTRWRMGPEYFPEWEGKVIASINVAGAVKTDLSRVLSLSGLKVGTIMTKDLENKAVDALYDHLSIEEAGIEVRQIPSDPSKVTVTIIVEEK